MKFIKNTKYIVSAGLVLAGAGILFATSVTQDARYYLTVDELRADDSRFLGRTLKVAGIVSKGSFRKTDGSLGGTFDLSAADAVVSVSAQRALPDAFREGGEVVVTGRYDRPGYVVAEEVLAKCASRYEVKLQPAFSPTR